MCLITFDIFLVQKIDFEHVTRHYSKQAHIHNKKSIRNTSVFFFCFVLSLICVYIGISFFLILRFSLFLFSLALSLFIFSALHKLSCCFLSLPFSLSLCLFSLLTTILVTKCYCFSSTLQTYFFVSASSAPFNHIKNNTRK